MAKKMNSKVFVLALTVGICLMLTGSGCAHHHSSQNTATNDGAPPPPDAGTDAVPQAAAEEPPAPSAINEESPPAPAADVNVAAEPQPPAEGLTGMNSSGDTPTAAPAAEASTGGSAATGTYTVRPGQTLMMIAFENYGDLYKWKEIYEANKDHISNPNSIPAGTILKLDTSQAPVAIEKNGDQYLIKKGDTLGTISNDVYGTQKKWKKLWENNKQIVKNPNRIYAGFYLYYTLTPEEKEQYDKRSHQTSPAPLANAATKGPAPASQ